MPLYEYFCPTCQGTFESLRPAVQADQPTTCPACCAESAQRVLSLVASGVNRGETSNASFADAISAGAGGGCCGGACGCQH